MTTVVGVRNDSVLETVAVPSHASHPVPDPELFPASSQAVQEYNVPHLSRSRTLAIGLGTLAALGAGAGAADGARRTLQLTCNYPLVGSLPATLDVTASRPLGNPNNPSPNGPYVFDAILTAASGDTSTWFAFHTARAATLAGTLDLGLVGSVGAFGNLPLDVPLTLATYTVPAVEQDLVLVATGQLPPSTMPGSFTSLKLADVSLNLRASKADGTPVTTLRSDTDSDGDPSTFDVPCTVDPGQDTELLGPTLDVVAPTPPGQPRFEFGSNRLSWEASRDDGGVANYDVLVNGEVVGTTSGPTSTFALPDGIISTGTYRFTVRARDLAGNVSQESAPTTIVVDGAPVDTPPTRPGQPVPAPGQVAQRTASLSWTASTDNAGVASYEILRDGAKFATSSGPSIDLQGLEPNTKYCLTVVAIDTRGNRSQASDEACFTTLPQIVIDDFGGRFAVAGSATLRTLTKGVVPIRGKLNAQFVLDKGLVSADLALEPAKARLTALGFIPVTASVAFITNGKTTGTIGDDGLKTTSSVRIKLPQVSLFGTIPLAGGTTCQTKQFSKIGLSSPDFDIVQGGTLKGTFSISDLSGCGALNGLVSPLTAGGGNTISLALTPNGAPVS